MSVTGLILVVVMIATAAATDEGPLESSSKRSSELNFESWSSETEVSCSSI